MVHLTQNLIFIRERKERVKEGGCDYVICGLWTAPKVDKGKTNASVSFKISCHIQGLDNCQILKARSKKIDQLKLDDAHNCRVVALPKAFTSWKWR